MFKLGLKDYANALNITNLTQKSLKIYSHKTLNSEIWGLGDYFTEQLKRRSAAVQAQVGSGDGGNGSLGGGALGGGGDGGDGGAGGGGGGGDGGGGGGDGVVGAKRCSYDDEVACNQIENMLVSVRCQGVKG